MGKHYLHFYAFLNRGLLFHLFRNSACTYSCNGCFIYFQLFKETIKNAITFFWQYYSYLYVLDRDDIMQAARLLLPGVDCPVRPLGEEAMRVRKVTGVEEDSLEATRQIKAELAFRLMASGRAELIQQALPLLPPPTRFDTLNHQGHTALMLAAIHNDDMALMVSILNSG